MSISRRSFIAGAAAAPTILVPASEALATESTLLNSEDAIEFVYVDSACIAEGSEQHIVLGIADAAQGIKSAFLELVNDDSGSISLPLTSSSDSAVLFSYVPDSVGEYTISTLTYTVGGTSKTVDFSDCGSLCRTFTVSGVSEEVGVLTNMTSFSEEADAEPMTVSADDEELLSSNVDVSPLSVGSDILVALNPGHGGYDSGATDNGAYEADMTWAIYRYCRAELELYSGVQVFCTRTQDECPSLQERVNRAKAVGCDAYVSLHINAGGGTGAEVYYPYNSSFNNSAYNVGKNLADAILEELSKLGLNIRGAKDRIIDEIGEYGYDANGDGSLDTYADYYGDIRYSRLAGMPGIIVEHAFIDSLDYYNYLNSPSKLQALGVADATAIAKVFGLTRESDDPSRVKMYRLYNPYTGEHLYTSSRAERLSLISAGWSSEGVAWRAPSSGDPVYRLYNPYTSDHHYTMSEVEVISLVDAGWNHEGIGWYSDPNEAVPLHRLYNPNVSCGTHHYTTSEVERDSLVQAGWKYEGVSWYGVD